MTENRQPTENMPDWASILHEKIASRSAKVAVIGLGYVGLPLALEAARAGFKVTGIDRDEKKAGQVNSGESYLLDIPAEMIREQAEAERLWATSDFTVLREMDVVVICVPTPLNNRKEPDTSFISDAVRQICQNSRPGQLITLESTSYPGTTDEMLIPPLKEKGLVPGEDVFIAFAPERLDPGNAIFVTRTIPKVVGGVTKKCLAVAVAFYKQVINEVKAVSSPVVAEMTKILENTYRAVNISLVNELMLLCDRTGVDIWEVIEAAATKPFGIQTFYPGPGIGGHCISVDPFYLAWKAKEFDFHIGFIDWAGRINSQVIDHVVHKVNAALNDRGRCLNGSRILVVGVAYKRDTADTRESPALAIMEKLIAAKSDVSFYDPHVDEVNLFQDNRLEKVALEADVVAAADCILIITDHTAVDYQWLVDQASLVVDTRNATGRLTRGREKVVRI